MVDVCVCWSLGSVIWGAVCVKTQNGGQFRNMRTFTKSPQTFTYCQPNNCTCKWTFTKSLRSFTKSPRTFTSSAAALGTWTFTKSLWTFTKSPRTFTKINHCGHLLNRRGHLLNLCGHLLKLMVMFACGHCRKPHPSCFIWFVHGLT